MTNVYLVELFNFATFCPWKLKYLDNMCNKVSIFNSPLGKPGETIKKKYMVINANKAE